MGWFVSYLILSTDQRRSPPETGSQVKHTSSDSGRRAPDALHSSGICVPG